MMKPAINDVCNCYMSVYLQRNKQILMEGNNNKTRGIEFLGTFPASFVDSITSQRVMFYYCTYNSTKDTLYIQRKPL